VGGKYADRVSINPQHMSTSSSVLRMTFIVTLIVALFLGLFARLWFLQVLAGERYVELADSNRVRTVITEAPRGRILSADGVELARNRVALALSVDRQVLFRPDGQLRDADAERVIGRLAELLELDTATVLQRLSSQRRSPFRPVPIAIDITPEMLFFVRERQEMFPGVVAEYLPVREYPNGEVAAHLVGTVGEVSQTELSDPRFSEYRGGDILGRGGLESSYEAELRGVQGRQLLVANARGTVLGVQSQREPVEGNTLVTTIDFALQDAVERALRDGIEASRSIRRPDGRLLPSVAGSAVVLNAKTGAVLAMASYPTFDPAEFVGGVSQDYWAFVNDPQNYRPLVNRAIAGAYPPGSVFKTASGAAFMQAGLISPQQTRRCDASFTVGGTTFRNWNRGVNEGPMTIVEAMLRSCDTYFYDLAYENWRVEQRRQDGREYLVEVANRFGFGVNVGIDLPGSVPGRVPGRQWRQEFWENARDSYCTQAQEATPGSLRQELLDDLCRFGGVWRGGDAINSSIGQGDVLATPLQVAVSYQALANGGVVMRPHLGSQIVAPDGTIVRQMMPERLGDLGLSSAELAALVRGLELTVNSPRGTAFNVFASSPLASLGVAGKTGTAEVRPLVPYAWFAGYAPMNDPEIVVVVNVEQGGGGSQTAAPIVRTIMEHYFGFTVDVEGTFTPGEEILD
jgi:penicillin-binding protein 2